MFETKRITAFERFCNAIEFIGILFMLGLAVLWQIIYKELPCPLCLLQRLGFFGVAFGFLLNLRFGFRPSHYAIVLLSALFTAFVALRQIALHVVPGSGSYGSAILGMHLYSWSFVAAMVVVIVTILLMSVDRQYQVARKANIRWRHITYSLFLILLILLIINIVGVILECGFKACPDDPVNYQYFLHIFGVKS